MGITRNTLDSHMKKLFDKSGMDSSVALVVWAFKHKLVEI